MKTSNGFGDMPAMCENEDGKPLPVTLTGVARNHVASFDYFVQHGLSEIVKRLRKVTLQIPATKDPSSRVHVWFDEISLGKPSREGDGTSCSRDPRLFPRECRESSATYKAPMSATLAWSFGEADNVYRRKFRLCSFPVMIGSVACHLWGASSGDLIRRGEERYEAGGYFILNGIERIIRLLIQQRQHYIMYGRIPSLRLHSCSRTALTYNKCFFALLNFHGNLFYPSFQGNGRLQLLSYLAEDSSKACHPTHILNVAPSCSSINLLVLRDLMKRE